MRRSLGFQQQYYADGGMWMETQAQQQGYAFHEESWSSDNNYHKQFPGMHMNSLGAFRMDSELSMSKHHDKLGGMHMNRLGAFAMDSELSMSKQQHAKLGGMHKNRLGAFAMDSEHSMSKQHEKLGGMHKNRLGAFAMDSEHSMSKQHGKLGGSNGMFQESMHSDHGYVYVHGGGRKFPFGGNNVSHHISNGGAKFNSGGHHEYYSEEAYTEEHAGTVTAKVDEMRYQHHNWGGDTCYISPYDRN